MTDRTIIEIPLELLHDSPFNPPDRATLRIDEMAATIRSAGGILSALLVRPRTGDNVEGGYEVVFGHRRKYGGLAAGLATAPCEVRALTDAEARELQAIENVQRENLKALEEATQYQGMVDGGKSANEVAAAIGKSRSHVYGRLRLLDLCPQVLEALKSGEVKGEVALLIARVGDHKMQAKALQVIRNHNTDIDDGGARSYRRIRELLNEKFTLDLGKAIFPIEAEMLVPSAGNCVTCRKRTGNAPEFEDVAGEKTGDELEQEEARLQHEISQAEKAGEGEKADALYERMQEIQERGYAADRVRHRGANVCTDPDCFEAKVKAHLKAEAKRLEAEGATVITGGKARQAINARGELGEGYVVATKIDLAKAKGDVKPVTILNPRDGTTLQAYRAEDLQAAGVKVKATKAKVKVGYSEADYQREQERRRAEAAAEGAARLALLKAVRAASADAPRGEFDLRLVARAMVDRLPHDDRGVLGDVYGIDSHQDLHAAIDAMDPGQLGRLLLDCAIVENVAADQWNHKHQKPEALLLAAGHYRVDIEAARAAVQTPATEPAAAPVAKKGGKKRATEEQTELL